MNSELWHRLEAFDLDVQSSALNFSQRLARENSWPPEFALRVVVEYKRFLYLCVEAGHPVTPSDEVDQAWHLHLVYTRSYWDDLCGEVLGRPIHHGPTKGGFTESEKFQDWYGKTLQSYEHHFAQTPPPDIWPAGEKRFAGRFQRVDLGESLVIPKRVLVYSGVAATVGLSLAGCTASSDDLGAILFLGLPVLLIILFLKSLGGGGGKGGKGGKGGGSSGGSNIGGFGWFGGGCSNDSGCGSGCGGGGCGGGGGD